MNIKKFLLKQSDAKLLVIIFLLSFAVRFALVLIIHTGLSPELQKRIIPPDAQCAKDALVAFDSWWRTGKTVTQCNSTYYLYVGWVYHILGYHPLHIEVINSLLGAAAVFFIYAISKKIFDRKTAYVSVILYFIFPSLNFWSSLNLRDTPILFAVMAAIWAALELEERFRLSYLLLALPLLWSLNRLRYYMYIILMYSVILFFLVNISKMNYKRNIAYALFFFVFMCLFPKSEDTVYKVGIFSSIPQSVSAFFTRTPGPNFNMHNDFKSVDEKHKVLATGGAAIAPEVDISTPLKAVKYLPKGMAYFLFLPFPWKAEGMLQKAAVPENVLWYAIFPFVLYGMYIARGRWRPSFVIIFFLTVTLMGYSLVSGNFGAAYRHKAVLLPLFFIYAAAGIAHLIKTRLRSNL